MRLQTRKEPLAGWYCPLPMNSFIHFMWIVAYILLLSSILFYFVIRLLLLSFVVPIGSIMIFYFPLAFFSGHLFPFAHRFQSNWYCECATGFVSSPPAHATHNDRLLVWLLLHATNSAHRHTAGCRRHVRFDAIVCQHFERFSTPVRTKENCLRRNSHLDFHMMSTKNNNYYSNAAFMTIAWEACRRKMLS